MALDLVAQTFRPVADAVYPGLDDIVVVGWAASMTYIVLVFAGMAYMRGRAAYDTPAVREVLFWWNLAHSLFSGVWLAAGVYCVQEGHSRFGFPSLLAVHRWPGDAVCKAHGLVYLYSKWVEFGDTAFLVARKKPISFLAVFHHWSTALVVAMFYSETDGADGLARALSSANLLVHFVMYGYFAAKSKGVQFPSFVPPFLTSLQITQMCYLAWLSTLGYNRGIISFPLWVSYFGIVFIFGLLFLKFAVERYVFKSSHHHKSGDKRKKQ